jgi:hypothetical protein
VRASVSCRMSRSGPRDPNRVFRSLVGIYCIFRVNHIGRCCVVQGSAALHRHHRHQDTYAARNGAMP